MRRLTVAHRRPLLMYRLAAVLLCAPAAGACGGSTAPAALPAPPGTRAAEPAVAPALTVRPVGRVVAIGAQPEGVVADGVTHLVAVGKRQPYALTLFDEQTGRITRRIPLPGHLRHLQLAKPGGPVLVPDENSDSLLTVDLTTGAVTSRVHTGTSPHDATRAANGDVFVANEGGRSVAVVRGSRVVRSFADVSQPAGLAAVGDTVGLVDVRLDQLHLYDAATLTSIGRLPAGAGPTHLVADRRGRLAVIDTRGNAVLFYQLTPRARLIGRLALPGTPYGVAYDSVRDRLWVTLTAMNQLVGIPLGASTPRVTVRLATVRQPNTVAVDSATGRLFVTGTHDGVLQIIQP